MSEVVFTSPGYGGGRVPAVRVYWEPLGGVWLAVDCKSKCWLFGSRIMGAVIYRAKQIADSVTYPHVPECAMKEPAQLFAVSG